MTKTEFYMLDAMNHLDLEFVEAADRRRRSYSTALLKGIGVCIAVVAVLVAGVLVFPFVKDRLPFGSDPSHGTTRSPEVQNLDFSFDTEEGLVYEMTLEVTDGVVTAVNSTNPTATAPVEEAELYALDLQAAVKKLVKVAFEEGYIRSEKDVAELINNAGEGSVLRQIFFEWTVEIAETIVDERYVTACRGARPPIPDETAKELASFFGVKKKRVQYLMNLFKYSYPIEIIDLCECKVHDVVLTKMYSVAYPPKYQAGEYDEYGEQVLYAWVYEAPIAFIIPFEDYPKFYQEKMRKYYTEEDLAILYGPSVWTTMPNVLAQSEQQVVDLLHRRNIAVRINYTETDQIWGVDDSLEYEVGDCIMQEEEPGRRIRSDSGVTIWVYDPQKAAAQKEALAEG